MAKSSRPTDPTDLPLTDKQQRFVDAYIDGPNAFHATRCAVDAGYSEKAAKKYGSEVMRKPHVRAEINRRCLEAQVRLEVTGDHIRQGFAQIAFDPRDVAAGGPDRVERMTALDRLAKLFGLYIEKHVFTGATLEQLLALAEEREKTLPAPTPPLRLIEGGKT